MISRHSQRNDDNRSTPEKLAFNELIWKLCTSSMDNSINARKFIMSRCLRDLANCRHSAYYKSIREKIDRSEFVSHDELAYFALTTEDVNLLAGRYFEQFIEVEKQYRLSYLGERTYTIQLAALRWKTDRNPDELLDCLKRRGYDRDDTYFLNLRGIDLSGMNISGRSLVFVDLENAMLFRTRMDSSSIRYANLTNARLNDTDATKLRLIGCQGSKTNFARARLIEPYIAGCEFDEAIFPGTKLKAAQLDKTVFKKCDFATSKIKLATNKLSMFTLKKCKLINATLQNLTHASIAAQSNGFLPDSAFTTELLMNTALDEVAVTLPLPENQQESEMELYQVLIADSIIARCKKLEMAPDIQIELLKTAMNHRLFTPTSPIDKFLNSASNQLYKFACRLFGKENQRHWYLPNKSAAMIDNACVEIYSRK